MTRREREKKREKRLRAKFHQLDGLARKGIPGARERRDTLDEKLKLIGIRQNAWGTLNQKLERVLEKKSGANPPRAKI